MRGRIITQWRGPVTKGGAKVYLSWFSICWNHRMAGCTTTSNFTDMLCIPMRRWFIHLNLLIRGQQARQDGWDVYSYQYYRYSAACADRAERLGWMGDRNCFLETESYYMDTSAFLTKWMQDIVDAQAIGVSGTFHQVCPIWGDIESSDGVRPECTFRMWCWSLWGYYVIKQALQFSVWLCQLYRERVGFRWPAHNAYVSS